MIETIIIFLVCMTGAFFLGRLSKPNPSKFESSGYLHIVEDSDEPQPYIFLELTSKSEVAQIQLHDYVTLKVLRN